MSQVVIVREGFKTNASLSFLPAFDKVRYSSALECDILFSTCRPSLACVVVDLTSGDHDAVEQGLIRMGRVQNQFKNCFAVVLIHPNNISTLNCVQVKLEFGLLRLFHSTSIKSVPEIIYNYFCIMKDSCKLEQQTQYFEEERVAITSPDTAKTIIGETMSRLGVTDDCGDEVATLSYSLPSIGDIIAAEHSTLQYVPVGIRILDAVEQFFGFDTTRSDA